MQMSLRNGNIGLAVAVAMMVIGALIVGNGASDMEMQLIFWPAFLTGIAVMLILEGREERRQRRDRSPRGR
ncbi:MAG TPA: hypothetical protein VHF88_07875 [Thermoleophilaceae bacterium]|nr:hypothetical protein [Thermoleophilaceae bacterium]